MHIKLSTVIFVLLSLTSTFLSAQIADFDEDQIEQDFYTNINLYSEKYVKPVVSGYGIALGTGWQTRSRLLKPFEFSVGLHAVSTFTPDEELEFDFNEVPFTPNFKLENPQNPIIPTVLGGETEKYIIYETEGQTLLGPVKYQNRLPVLSGITSPFNATPNASIYADMGLPAKFELNLRLFPPFKILNVNHYQTGIGLRHEISHYFLGEEHPLKLLVSGNYNFSKFSYVPEEFFDGKNRNIIFKANAVNLNLQAAYTYKSFSLFLVPSYSINKSNFKIDGTYEYKVEENLLVQEAFSVTDPVDIVNRENLVNLTLGTSIAIADRIEIALAYQFSEYNSLSLNFGYLINSNSE
ncbi:MAG: hypothetical protein RH860_12970 [Cytophagales bacterium]